MSSCKTVCLRRLGGDRKGELQAGRFFASPRVTAAKLVAGWSDLTGAACAGRHVLAIQDRSEVKFPTTVQCRRDLGPVVRACPRESGGKRVRGAGACDDRGGRHKRIVSRPG